mgnify:CR=1 FL=1
MQGDLTTLAELLERAARHGDVGLRFVERAGQLVEFVGHLAQLGLELVVGPVGPALERGVLARHECGAPVSFIGPHGLSSRLAAVDSMQRRLHAPRYGGVTLSTTHGSRDTA